MYYSQRLARQGLKQAAGCIVPYSEPGTAGNTPPHPLIHQFKAADAALSGLLRDGGRAVVAAVLTSSGVYSHSTSSAAAANRGRAGGPPPARGGGAGRSLHQRTTAGPGRTGAVA